MSVNTVILVGNLGKDPELRTFANGGQVANVSLATTSKWKDKQTGELRSETEWHKLVFNGRLAEIASQYLRKGSKVYVMGSIRTRKWQDQSGQDHYSTEIRVDQMQMLDGKAALHDSQAPHYQSSKSPVKDCPQPEPGFAEDDVPFADPFSNVALCLAS